MWESWKDEDISTLSIKENRDLTKHRQQSTGETASFYTLLNGVTKKDGVLNWLTKEG